VTFEEVYYCPLCRRVLWPRPAPGGRRLCGLCGGDLRHADGPSVELLIGTYDRVERLPATLATLQAQTHTRFRASVLDEHPTRLASSIVGSFHAVRFSHRPVGPWRADWHYTVRHEAALRSGADWLGFPTNDGLYAPVYLERMLAAADGFDLVACDWVYAHAGYQPWTVEPRVGHIDLGGYLIRTAAYRAVGGFPNRGHEADGQLVELLIERGYRVGLLRQTLYVQG